MRFVFLTLGYHPDIDGGAYRYAAEVAEVLAGRGHEVHALTKNPDGTHPAEEVRNGVRIRRITGPGGGFLRNWSGIVTESRRCLEALRILPGATRVVSHHAYFERALRGVRPVVFFHGPWGLEHRFACEARFRPLHIRWRDALVSRLLHRTEGQALRSASRILVASRYMEGKLAGWHPGVAAPREVVGGGANHARFNDRVSREEARQKFGAQEDESILLSVRRLDPRMGLALLIRAFSRTTADHPKARLWIAGKGAQREELERLTAESGLSGRVRFLGFVPEADLPGLYAAADLVVMPSLDLEGFGLVTAEALACGTPVLASDAGANAEVVGDLCPQLIFESGSVPALADRVSEVLDGTVALPSRGQCAEFARARFRWERPADAFERAAEEQNRSGGLR
jgi:glycosyltransferase involved in cell wall biosynthesis